MENVCTSAGCYLQQNGGLVSLATVTIAGLVDGINPCAIGMVLLLLGYIIVFAKKPEKVLKLGGIYILTVYFTYLSIGLLFYRSVVLLDFTPYKPFFDRFLGTALLLAGLVNIKDFFLPGKWISLQIPQKARPNLMKLVEGVSTPTTIVLAVLVTLLETPCSLPIYIATARILNQAGLLWQQIIFYFIYYNFLFVLPLIVILLLVWRGREMVTLKEWEHKAKKWMKLAIGVLLVLMSLWLLVGFQLPLGWLSI